MRATALFIAAVLVLAGIPGVAGKHTSIGSEDVILADSEEDPGDPTVTEEDHQTGVSTDCVEIEPEDRHDEAALDQARGSDAFCGELVYHEGTEFETLSAPDQQYNGPIGHFDVVRTWTPAVSPTVWSPIASEAKCVAWCGPGGDALFYAVHDVGAQAGLTETGEEADRQEGDRGREYGLASPAYPAAGDVVQDQTNAWRMNGWYHAQAVYEHFVGFLENDEGQPISQADLVDIVDSHRDKFGDRPVQPSVCGFTPDTDASTVLSQDGFCEVNFYYAENRGDQTSFQDGYDYRCGSPTYVCGAVQPAWHAKIECWAYDPCTQSGSYYDEFDYTRWHWAVAPTQSECGGQQTPGMAFDTPTGADWAFLAHDLDVWTPPTELQNVDGTSGMDNVRDWAGPSATDPLWAAGSLFGQALGTVWETRDTVAEELPGGSELLPNPPATQKPHRVEPNAKTGKFVGLAEDSQTIEIPRSGPNEDPSDCDRFFNGVSTEVVDPWVNIVDTDTVAKGHESTFGTFARYNLYGNNRADHQDDVNQGTNGYAYFNGKVGVFTDKFDNGGYRQPTNEDVWSQVYTYGAYPTLWDMRLDPDGTPAEAGGCTMGFSETPLHQEMVDAHYGTHTGLVLAVYLEEPSALTDGQDHIPFPDGENIFLFESQAMHTLRQLQDDDVLAFENRILEGLRSHPDVAGDADARYVTDVMDTDNAFAGQCDERSGGFTTAFSVLHQCETGCEGDTIVTGYMGESTHPDNELGSAGDEPGNIPKLQTEEGPFAFPSSIVTWTDVDPFDNNPDRNREESSSPPN